MEEQRAVSAATRRRAVALMAACAVMWSIGGLFIKMIPWNPMVIAGIRSLVGAAVIGVYMLFRKMPLIWNRTSVLAGVALAVTYHTFVAANKLTTAANAIVLQSTAPIFIVLLSALFYKQVFRRADYLAVGMVLLGTLFCFADQLGTGTLAGNFLGVFSGISFASMYVITGNTDEHTRMSGLLLGQLFTAAVGAPAAFIYDTPLTGTAIAGILILGIVQLGVPYIFYGLAVRHCPPLICSLIGALEPLLNPVWVFLFTGEAPGPLALAGGVVVIATIAVWNVLDVRKTETKTE